MGRCVAYMRPAKRSVIAPNADLWAQLCTMGGSYVTLEECTAHATHALRERRLECGPTSSGKLSRTARDADAVRRAYAEAEAMSAGTMLLTLEGADFGADTALLELTLHPPRRVTQINVAPDCVVRDETTRLRLRAKSSVTFL